MKNAMPDKVKTKAAWGNESSSKKGGNMMSEEKNSDVKTRPHFPILGSVPIFPATSALEANSVILMNRIFIKFEGDKK